MGLIRNSENTISYLITDFKTFGQGCLTLSDNAKFAPVFEPKIKSGNVFSAVARFGRATGTAIIHPNSIVSEASDLRNVTFTLFEKRLAAQLSSREISDQFFGLKVTNIEIFMLSLHVLNLAVKESCHF
ncbi:13671_t:CDS:2 [Funneliformis mosseae]|uniref:13671_t:CDS:1 n=1 Tax=Funneliformis mosseae TaxID=27381 RepID=A0A9N8YRK4_FUNMO|nr:13671_t:CDS:2 [Funneliformis mosseae]